MSKQTDIKIFDDKKIRTIWDTLNEKWYISIVDVIAILTDSPNPQVYWRVLKKRLKAEGNETVTNCNGLKMPARDGKMRLTDVADTKQLFRLIQSIPSPNTELILNMLAEASTKDISVATKPKDFEESKIVANQGGNVAKVARKELEAKTGKNVVTSLNAKKRWNPIDLPNETNGEDQI